MSYFLWLEYNVLAATQYGMTVYITDKTFICLLISGRYVLPFPISPQLHLQTLSLGCQSQLVTIWVPSIHFHTSHIVDTSTHLPYLNFLSKVLMIDNLRIGPMNTLSNCMIAVHTIHSLFLSSSCVSCTFLPSIKNAVTENSWLTSSNIMFFKNIHVCWFKSGLIVLSYPHERLFSLCNQLTHAYLQYPHMYSLAHTHTEIPIEIVTLHNLFINVYLRSYMATSLPIVNHNHIVMILSHRYFSDTEKH